MKRFLFITLLIILSYSLNPSRQAVAGSISAAPVNPSAGQAVTFQYVANVTASVKWNFGDGNSSCKGAEAVFTHTFVNPGSYTVRAWDTFCDDGAAPTATKIIIVGAGAPGVVSAPGTVAPVLASQAFEIQSGQLLFQDGTTSVTIPKNKTGLRAKVTLQGEGTGRVRLQWLLDGQPFSSQVKMVNFSRQRNVTIQLNRDLPTQIPGSSHSVSLRIQEPRSPKAKIADISYGVGRPAFGASAGFTVSYIELRFKNRSAYINVGKNHTNFKAYADFKCEGAGTLQVQWLVDGKPFFIQSKSVNFAETVTIDSGRNLPTLVAGSHTVSIRLLSPQTRLKIPVIKYLVGGQSGAEASKYNVDIKFNSYQDNFGKVNSFSGTTLRAKQGEYLVMNGTVINKGEMAIPKGFMQMYIDGKLMATQAIRLIPPGGLIPFNTSIQFPPEVQKSQLEFRFADKLGVLMHTTRLRLLATTDLKVIEPVDLSDLSAPAPEQTSHVPIKVLYFKTVNNPILDDDNIYVDVKAEGVYEAYVSFKHHDGFVDKINILPKPDNSIEQTVNVGAVLKKRVVKIGAYKGKPVGANWKKDKDGKPFLSIHLNIKGRNRLGQVINKSVEIFQYLGGSSRFHDGGGKMPKIKEFDFIASEGDFLDNKPTQMSKPGRFNIEVKNAGFYELTYIETGEKVLPNRWYWESSAKKDTYAISKNHGDILPGLGIYQLKAQNIHGVVTRQIYIHVQDAVIGKFSSKAWAMGCDDDEDVSKNKEKNKRYEDVIRFKGKGRKTAPMLSGCDECGRYGTADRNRYFYEDKDCVQNYPEDGFWETHSTNCRRGKYDCSKLLQHPGYNKHQNHIGGTKPKVAFYIPGASNATNQHGHMNYLMIGYGTKAKLVFRVTDTSTNTKFQRNMRMRLFATDMDTGMKKLVQTWKYQGGYEKAKGDPSYSEDTPYDKRVYSTRNGWKQGDKYKLEELSVSPSSTTKYTITADNIYGEMSISNMVLIRNKNIGGVPRIKTFTADKDEALEGESITLTYDFQAIQAGTRKAFITAEVEPAYSTTKIADLRVRSKSGAIRGTLKVTLKKSTRYTLNLVYGEAGVIKKQIVVTRVANNNKGNPPWVKFLVDPSPPVVTVGQTIKLTCKVANAKSAIVYLVDDGSGDMKSVYQIPRHVLATSHQKVIQGSFQHNVQKGKHYLLLALNENGKSTMGMSLTIKKPEGSLTPDKKTYMAGEQIILSYSVRNAVVAYIDYSLPDGRGKQFDIPLQQGAAQGTLKMSATSSGGHNYATIGAGPHDGTIAKFSSYSAEPSKKQRKGNGLEAMSENELGKVKGDSVGIDVGILPEGLVSGKTKPTIETFSITPMNNGKTLQVSYKYRNATVARFGAIWSHSGKSDDAFALEIKPNKNGSVEGSFNTGHYSNSKVHAFKLWISNGSDEDFKLIKVGANGKLPPSSKVKNLATTIKPRFHSSVTADKKSVRLGETFTLECKYAFAEKALVFDKSTGKQIAILPVFQPGTIGAGQAKITIPLGFTKKSATYTVKLSNSNGTVQEPFSIDVDRTR